MKKVRRWLYLTHRWLGIVTCLLTLLWFGSGLVMMYVPYPSLKPAERVAALAPIAWQRVRVQPGLALSRAELAAFPRELRLEMQRSRPVYRMTGPDGARIAISAETGERLRPIGAAEAGRIATAFALAPAVRTERIVRDQWTVAQGFDPSRPLWRVRLADGRGTDIYISSLTGEPVQHTTAWERGWNWAGAIPHWLYLTAIRRDGAFWRQVVMWTSGPATIVGLTGLWIGVLRWRPTPKRRIPYREPWMRWHHIVGLIGGLTMLTWMASGWLSVNPFGWFDRKGDPEIGRRYADHPQATFVPVDLMRLGRAAAGARELRFVHVGGEPSLLIRGSREERRLDARSLSPVEIDREQLTWLARRAAGSNSIRAVERLERPDLYWYSHWNERPLPVWRVRLADAERSWLHIDAETGVLLDQSTAETRAYRWLFNFLHDFDLPILLEHRWLRDPLMWLLLTFGVVLSATGIVIGWRRLWRPRPASAPRQTARTRSGRAW